MWSDLILCPVCSWTFNAPGPVGWVSVGSLFEVQTTQLSGLGILLSTHCSCSRCPGRAGVPVCCFVWYTQLSPRPDYHLLYYFWNFDDYVFKSGIILELLPFISPVARCEKNTWAVKRANVIWNSSRGNKHKLDNVIGCASALGIIFWL